MKATELQIINFLQAPKVQFVIPIYQRNTIGASRFPKMTELNLKTKVDGLLII